jgi:antitoxin VapB
MGLNIDDPETERLAAEVAALAGETKARAVKVALTERRDRLRHRIAPVDRAEALRRLLEDEIWPQIPPELLGKGISKAEQEKILGYGPEGV